MTTIFQSAWWTVSRTMYFNVLVAIFGVIDLFMPFVPAPYAKGVILAVAVGNIFLRVLTQAKLTAQENK